MEKTNSEPLQEAKTTAAANSEEPQKTSGDIKVNPMTRLKLQAFFVLSILSLEIPWLVNGPSIIKLILLPVAAILLGLMFAGLFAGALAKSGKTDSAVARSMWLFTGLYLIVNIAVGLIYILCPGLRINGWLYILINLAEAVVTGLLGAFFALTIIGLFGNHEITEAKVKLFLGTTKVLTILAVIAAAVCTVYFGWPILKNNSSPILAMLLPGLFLGGSALAGQIVILVLVSPFLKKAMAIYKNQQNK